MIFRRFSRSRLTWSDLSSQMAHLSKSTQIRAGKLQANLRSNGSYQTSSALKNASVARSALMKLARLACEISRRRGRKPGWASPRTLARSRRPKKTMEMQQRRWRDIAAPATSMIVRIVVTLGKQISFRRCPSRKLWRVPTRRAYQTTLKSYKTISTRTGWQHSKICRTRAKWKCIVCPTNVTLWCASRIESRRSVKRSAWSATMTTCSRSIWKSRRWHL